MMASGEVSEDISIPALGQKDIEVSIEIDDSKIPEWWVTHIENDERTTVSIDLQVGFEINGKEHILDLDTYEYEFYTNIAS
jgi:LEA14-like dessication related protein